jgi:hypothetical protein
VTGDELDVLLAKVARGVPLSAAEAQLAFGLLGEGGVGGSPSVPPASVPLPSSERATRRRAGGERPSAPSSPDASASDAPANGTATSETSTVHQGEAVPLQVRRAFASPFEAEQAERDEE